MTRRVCRVAARGVVGLAVLLACAGPAQGQQGQEVRFTRPPEAQVLGRRAAIRFAVSGPTDVAVTILDRDGEPIRHLAAGLIGGPNAAAPLAPNSLEQTLVWDGADDSGRPAPPGRYSVHVALGLTARFGKILGEARRRTGAVHGLAIGPEGMLYVMCEPGRDTRDGRVVLFSRNESYLRTIVPRPAGLPLARVRSLGEVVLRDGSRVPLDLLPGHAARSRQQPAVLPNGDLVFVSGPNQGHTLGKRYQSVPERQHAPRRLLRIDAVGGVPDNTDYLGPVLGEGFDSGTVYLAASPDGRTIYVSGGSGAHAHAVYQTRWGADETPTPLFGTPGRSSGGETGLNDPAGIAVDAAGQLYIADRGNHRVLAVTAEGKPVDQIAVDWPSHVAVHARKGSLYVVSGYRGERLVKFRIGGGRSAELPIRSDWPALALDSRQDPPVLYVGNLEAGITPTRRGGKALVRVVDEGLSLRIDRQIASADASPQPFLLGVDRDREWVYAFETGIGPYVRYDGRTGRVERFDAPTHPKANGVHELTVAPGGTVSIHVTGEFGRIDPRLRPLPFAASGTFIARQPTRFEDTIRSFYDRGSCVAPNGDVYWVHERGGYSQPMRVSVLGVDGKIKHDSLIVSHTRSTGPVRVDRQGNIYLLDHVKPVDRLVPEAFDGVVPIERANKVVYNYGSLLKFRPTGGTIHELGRARPQRRDLPAGQLQFTTAEGRGDFVAEGVLWSYFGVSMIQPALDRIGCMCSAPRFDVDDFARAFVPDQLRNRITVLDAAGNVLLHFGRYGNADEFGPDIAFGDPRTVMVSREAAYVGDMTNSRALRVDLSYRAQADCAVELGAAAPDAATDRRVAALRKLLRDEAVELSPGLDRRLNWDALAAPAAQATGPGAVDDAFVRLLLACRDVRDWDPAEAATLLRRYLADKSDRIRLAAVWALWDNPAGRAGLALLRGALKDESELVRVTAADTLLRHGDAAGLAEIFRAARSDNADVYKLAETAILKKVLVWNEENPKARTIDPSSALAPAFAMGAEDVQTLGQLLSWTGRGADYWYLRRAVIFLIGTSGRPEAVGPLMEALAVEKNARARRNLNRVIGSLGVLRARAAVPELVALLARGPGSADQREYGDQAETFAADALARIADPESVKPIIALLDSDTPRVPHLARRTLSRMFDPDIPADQCLVPDGEQLKRVRIDELPAPTALRAAWEAFWKTHGEQFSWNRWGAIRRIGFFGLEAGRRPARIAYVIDKSGSLAPSFPYITVELHRSIQSLTPEQQYVVIFFAHGGPTGLAVEGELQWRKATDANTRATGEWIDEQIAQSMTKGRVMEGLEQAFKVPGGAPEAIHFLTDGLVPAATLELLRKLNADKKVRINTILWVDRLPEAEQQLRQMARENGGVYRHIPEEQLGTDY